MTPPLPPFRKRLAGAAGMVLLGVLWVISHVYEVAFGVLTWALVLGMLGVWTVKEFVRHPERVRRAKLRRAICLGCGYDLRATPARCPECGLVVEK